MNIKIKILITTLIILMFCNTSMAITETHIWDKEISFSDSYSKAPSGIASNRHGFERIYTNDINDIEGLYFGSVSVDVDKIGVGAFPKVSEYWNVEFKINSDILGTGIAGYSKGQTKIFINYWVQSEGGLKALTYTGTQKIIVSGMPGYGPTGELNVEYGHQSSPSAYKFMPYRRITDSIYMYGGGNQDINYYTYQYFYNKIMINDDGNIINASVFRSAGNKSKFKISDPYEQINETVFSYADLELYTTNESVLFYGINLNSDIWEYTYEREEVPGIPTLTTDKTYYNTSEIIKISFTDIDILYNECDEYICEKPYELHILYPVSDAYKQYGTKFIYPLTYNLEDETIFLNTSFLHPQNNYILGIVGTNGYYGLHDDILIFSSDFVVYPDDEYLSISCDAVSGCYTYNNAKITIYYKINNNSDIIIKDNDGNIINQYHNIINEGEIIYNIPDDINHNNIYPNWKIYLNNTEYSTSFNKGITVYWSQFQTPTPTPTYTPQPTPDINISEQIDDFKTEIQPIKDLVFGLSEVVIDNPDYNKDNIVDENEINHWFNSLIPICIIFLLIILYVGLKKNRND